MRVIARSFIEHPGHRLHGLHQFVPPLRQTHRVLATFELQPRLTSEGCRFVLVAADLRDLLRRVQRAIGEQAMQQEHIDQAHGLDLDAHRLEGMEVE